MTDTDLTSQDQINKSIGMCRLHGLHNTEATLRALSAERDALKAEVARLRGMEALQTKARAQHWLRRHIDAPEDAEVEALCEKHGYGAVMDAASRLWARTPHGFGAFYIGGCIGAWSDDEARAFLARHQKEKEE